MATVSHKLLSYAIANLFPPLSALQTQLASLVWRVSAWQINRYFNCFLALLSGVFNLLGLCMTGLVILKKTVYMFLKTYSNRLLRHSWRSLAEYSDRKSSQIPEFNPQHHSTVFSEYPFKRVMRRHSYS